MYEPEWDREISAAIRSLERIRKSLANVRAPIGSLQSDYPAQFMHSDWDCAESPTGNCMYTHESTLDCCIFCGEPDERK